ncbi:hypothetical protein DINM_007280 [Dirofilaria immitis]|nr:hypothetical protein [Dirofilaria immitis]
MEEDTRSGKMAPNKSITVHFCESNNCNDKCDTYPILDERSGHNSASCVKHYEMKQRKNHKNGERANAKPKYMINRKGDLKKLLFRFAQVRFGVVSSPFLLALSLGIY